MTARCVLSSNLRLCLRYASSVGMQHYRGPLMCITTARTLCSNANKPNTKTTVLDNSKVKDKPNVKEDSKVKAPRVKEYAVKQYLGFIDRYLEKFEKRFEKKYPKAYRIYKLVKDGVKVFLQDSKSYYMVASGIWYRQHKYEDYTHAELSNFRQIPSDMFRVAPVLIISLLPFANYVIFPIAYMFPRHLLCRQFWTEEQKVEFSLHYLKPRLQHYPKIRDLMEKEAANIQDVGLRKVFHDILHKLENDATPSVDEIIATRPLFETRPFGLDRLYRRHRVHMQWHVARSWNFPGRKSKMVESAQLLHAIDLSLLRETAKSLSHQELQQACFYRGLNADGLSDEQMINFLNNWVQVSKHVTDDSLSLLLHCNIFLTSTHSNNRKYLLKDVDVTRGVIESS